MSTILKLLENILGKDDSRRKVFVKFWMHYGYPDAYKTSLEAENHARLKKLLAAIDITQDSPELMTQHKVKAILSRRQFILQKFEFLFKSLGSQDQEMQGNILDFFKPLSHQSSILAVIPWCQNKMQKADVRKHHHSKAVASPVDTV